MSQSIQVNGQTINYPETGDTNWSDDATNFAIQTSAALGKIGLSSGTSVDITQTLDVTGNTTLDANLSVGGDASVTGNTTLTGNLTVNGNTQLGNANTDTIGVTGIVNVDSGVLYVDPTNNRVGINDTTPSEALDVTGNAAISGNSTIGGTLGVTGDVAINTNKFNITASSGNTTIAGTLGISNGTALDPAITPSGDTNTGLYSIGADKIGFSANGSRVGEFGVGYGGFTGNIIQVKSGVLTTRATTTSSNFVDTGLSASITPFYNTSQILILFSGSFSTLTSIARFNLVRNSTNIAQGTGGTTNSTGNFYSNTSSGFDYAVSQTTVNFLDSPSTTSAITYKIQFASSVNGTNIAMNGRLHANDFVGISTLILMEVQQ